MASEEFKTINYMHRLKREVERKADLLNIDKTEDSSVYKLIKACSKGVEISTNSLMRHLLEYDENPFWYSFLKDFEPDFDFDEDFKENCFLIMAIVEVVVKEVLVVGVKSTVMMDVERRFSEVKELFGDEFKRRYNNCLASYNDVDRFSILYWRALNDFRNSNNKSIEAEFKKIKKDVEDVEVVLDEAKNDFGSRSSSIETLLGEMEKRTGLLSLYAGFDKYAKVIKTKLGWLLVEKMVWILGIGGAILYGLYLNAFRGFDWISLIPLAGIVLLFSTLFKVNLKKTDQYEQIMSKVEHKLAVSVFYQSELAKMEEGEKKQAVNEEYYKFLFSNIETTEWNTPDVVNDISTILKNFKK